MPSPNASSDPDARAARPGFPASPLVPIVLALLALLVGGHACAAPAAAELEWHDAQGTVVPARALDLRIEASVSGLIAQTRVHQRYRNDTAGFLEGQYRLPLPEGAAVYELKLRIGSRVIEGEVREKGEARAQYRAAAGQGLRTSLVEQEKANLFRTAVANVAPGEEVAIEIAYWQTVAFHDGRFDLHLPLANPATCSQQLAIGTPDAGPATLTGASADVAPQRVSLEVDLRPGIPVTGIVSESHRITVERRGAGFLVRVADPVLATDRDFALAWSPQPGAMPRSALFVEQRPDGDYAMMMLTPPSRPAARTPRELVLVIDTSGSMLGSSMEQAKAALRLALDRLQPGDRFNVIEFNSVTRLLFPEPVDVGPGTLERARAFVGQLQANGGTQMLPALDAALAGTPPTGLLRQVVFVTDGEVSEEDGLYVLIERSLGATRLFPVGIGDAPNARFMAQAARMGRGSATVIRRIEDVSARMGELFGKLDRAALTELKLAWPGVADAHPAELPDLYHGEPLVVVAKLAHAKGRVEARGVLDRAPWQQPLALEQAVPGTGIARLWAMRRIDDLLYRMGRTEEESSVRPQVIAIALEHHLVTRYTSLVAVDRTPVRAPDQPLEGMGAPAGDALALAQGATPAPLMLLLGCAGLVLVALARLRVPARRHATA